MPGLYLISGTIRYVMKNSLILIGAGGHCQSVIDVVEATQQYEIAGIMDQAHKVGGTVSDYDIIGTDDQLGRWVCPEVCFLITVGQAKDSALRYQLYERVRRVGGTLATVISPRAYVSSRATVGVGSVVMHDALVNAHVRIGHNVIINTKALVEHGSQIGDHCHVATGAIINGDCRIGSHTMIGSQATVVHGITVGEQVIVGAGAVVTRTLSEPGVYVGVPARKKP